MIVEFSIEYKTYFGQKIYIEINKELLPMKCSEEVLWTASLDLKANSDYVLSYNYIVKGNEGATIKEAGNSRVIKISHLSKRIILQDQWQGNSNSAPFLRRPFSSIIYNKSKQKGLSTHAFLKEIIFRATAPAMEDSQSLYICGNVPALGAWDESKAVKMNIVDEYRWAVSLFSSKLKGNIEYKFIKKNKDGDIEWERGDNHVVSIPKLEISESYVIEHSELDFILRKDRFVGTAVPVFSLRSKNSCGIGDFGDLKLLIDWAATTGQHFIQLLPVNDCIASKTWIDSYPYKCISVMALNPLYLNLKAAGVIKDKVFENNYMRKFAEIDVLPQIDFEKVLRYKFAYTRKLFSESGHSLLGTNYYKLFAKENADWLPAYAAFCCLRDRYLTADFTQWDEYSTYKPSVVNELLQDKDERNNMDFYCYLQYLLHEQLSAAHAYANSKAVALKGDIPIGISQCSVEAWTSPQYFNMDSQAGAPPDYFSSKGQNWGFPTYNWVSMAKDGYAWWKRRLSKMAEYFDAYRIDHVLGFFRIWEIPSTELYGTMGHFSPALAYSADDLRSAGYNFQYERDACPFIRYYQIKELFGNQCEFVQKHFLDSNQVDVFALKENYCSQKAIAAWFNVKGKKHSEIKEQMLSLVSELLFVTDPRKEGYYHPCINAQSTYSYQALSQDQKHAFDNIYNDYFFHRNEAFWEKLSYQKLPEIVDATNMLACAEDLGMVPQCVWRVLSQLKILTLELQRMPKTPGWMWGDPQQYPYFSVCSPSSHDVSTIRGWWEENRSFSEQYYHDFLGFKGEVPTSCEPWLAERIIRANLSSKSILTIIPIQDWFATAVTTRREGPADQERINDPANHHHYWRYRMHLSLEDLLEKRYFNLHISQMIAGTR